MQLNDKQKVQIMLSGLAKTKTKFSLDNAREFLSETETKFIADKLGVNKGGFYGLLNAVPRLTITEENNQFKLNIEADNLNTYTLVLQPENIEIGNIAQTTYNLLLMEQIDFAHPEKEELRMKYTAAAAYFSSDYATQVLNDEEILIDFEPQDLLPANEFKSIMHNTPPHNIGREMEQEKEL